MSMMNQSGEEQVECPLCMEALEVDDLNFFPCTCGYQICRFCWHRIRTDENGLCPACRKAYPENPADFKPLTQEEVAKLKAEKRHKDQQRKQKITENRKHLANVRVVQRNLVFVVGLPMRLADPEVLKKHEYFGKFGKIHKVVINQSTTYAGSQGPSASAYVTYQKADDALRAIQAVNNIVVDGRTVKTSLGTTKYCSHFMKNQTCPKPDCMYLHDLGDVEASFTKEEMQQGKHQEYERKLHELLLNNYNQGNKDSCSSNSVNSNQSCSKEAWPSLQPGVAPPRTKSGSSTSTSSSASNCSNTSSNSSNNGCGTGSQNGCNANSTCYTHHGSSRLERRQKSDQTSSNVSSKGSGPNHKKRHGLEDHKGKGKEKSYSAPQDEHSIKMSHCKMSQNNGRASSKGGKEGIHGVHNASTLPRCSHPLGDVNAALDETLDGGLHTDIDLRATCEPKVSGSDEESESSSKGGPSGGRTVPTTHRTAALFEPDNNSFFSTNNFTKVSASAAGSAGADWPLTSLTLTHIPDVLPPVHSSEDWQAAFGFSNTAVSVPSSQSESPYPQGVSENPSLNSEYSGGKTGENCDTVSYDSHNGQAVPTQGFNCLSSSSSTENISLSGIPSSQEEYGLTEVGNLTEKLNELLLDGVNCTEVKEMTTCPAGNCEMSAENVRLHITASCENVRVNPDGQNHMYHNIPSPASSDDPSIFMVNKPSPVQSSNQVIPNGIQSLQAAKFLSEFHVKHNNVPNINKIPANVCVHPLMEGDAFSGLNSEGNASTIVVNANSHATSDEGPNLLCLLKSGHNVSRYTVNGDSNDSSIVSKCSNEKYSNSDIFKRQVGCESASEIIVYNRENEISVHESVAESSKENQRVPDDDLGFDPFHETQKALAEMMEKENMMLMLQGQHNDVRHPNSHISHLNQLHQQYQQMSHSNHHPAQFSQAAMFGANKILPGYPAPLQPQILQNNHRLPANVATISMCSKLDGITMGPSPGLASVPPRARLPPPGFTIAPNHMNAFGLGIPRAPSTTGNKILPFMGLGNSSSSSNSGNSSPIPLNLNSMSNNISINSALNVQQTLSNVSPPPILFPHSASQTNAATQLNNSYSSRNGTIVHNSTVPKAALNRFNVKEWPDNLRPLLPLINAGSGVSHSPVPLAFSGSNNPVAPPPTPPPPPPAPSAQLLAAAAATSSPSSSSSSSSPSSSPPPPPSSSTSSSPPSSPPSPPSCTPPPPSPPPTGAPAAPPMPATTLQNSSCNGPVHGAQKSPVKPWSGAGPCSDWTVLDPAIVSSRPHNIFSSSSVGHQHPIIFCNTHSLLNQQSQNAQYLHLQNTTHWLRSFASDGCLLYGTNIGENVSTSDWTVLSHNSNSVASPPPGFSLRMTSPQTSIENKLAVAASQEITKIESELCSDYC